MPGPVPVPGGNGEKKGIEFAREKKIVFVFVRADCGKDDPFFFILSGVFVTKKRGDMV